MIKGFHFDAIVKVMLCRIIIDSGVLHYLRYCMHYIIVQLYCGMGLFIYDVITLSAVLLWLHTYSLG